MVTSKLDTCRTRNYKSVVVKLLKLNILLTWKMILLSPALYFQLVCLFIVLALAYDHFFFNVGNYQKLICEYSLI